MRRVVNKQNQQYLSAFTRESDKRYRKEDVKKFTEFSKNVKIFTKL